MMRSDEVSPAQQDRRILAELSAELRVLHLERESVLGTLLPTIQRWLELDSVVLYSVRARIRSWELERWHAIGPPAEALPAVRRILQRSADFPFHYNPLAPPTAQRNVLVDARLWVETHAPPGTWDDSVLCRDALYPLGLHRNHQPRALLCDGPSLVGWFGALTERPLDGRQRRLLRGLIAPVRERLIAERRLADGPRVLAAFETILEHLGRPAFLVDRDGTIVHASAAGRAAFDAHPEIAVALRDALANRPNPIAFDLHEVHSSGVSVHAIAVQRIDGAEARIEACLAVCASRWNLTKRQREVLELVARGLGNATISAMLGCVERTIELHVTALLDRAGVDNRTALVARVLTAA